MMPQTPPAVMRQRGLTLVELMVAMVLGLLLLAGVASVYRSGEQAKEARDGLSALQENGRFAIRHLERGISAAGYPFASDVDPFIVDKDQLGTESTKLLTRDQDPAQQDLGDTITIAFKPRLPSERGTHYRRDCQGNEGTLNGNIVNSYFIERDGTDYELAPKVTTRRHVLKCWGSGSKSVQPIAEGVDAMRVRYGVDTDGDGQADALQTASQVNAAANWPQVVSVEVALLVTSGTPVRDPRTVEEWETEAFPALGEPLVKLADLVPAGERAHKARWSWRVFSTSIPLRNRMALCDGC